MPCASPPIRSGTRPRDFDPSVRYSTSDRVAKPRKPFEDSCTEFSSCPHCNTHASIGYLPAAISPEKRRSEGLTESPRAIQERLAKLAISLVTTNDELTGSIEGLMCVMMESMYQVNIGKLRRSWIAGRRAIGIAQLMELDRSDRHARYQILDPETRHDARFMWYRVIFLDRHLGLMLGLPQGSVDRSKASDEGLTNDMDTGRLERIQCAIASRILERNASS